MNEQISRELDVHGSRWNTVHDGYFSDPAAAAPLIRQIKESASQSRPDTIIDLGGGTGFLLSQLQAAGIKSGTALVDLDDSSVQIEAARSAGFSCFHGSVDSFSRHDLTAENESCLFMMRSVLHYFGEMGLRRVLRHLHAQTRPGELFVHQTVSFSRRQDANCLNSLYLMMRTQKWYPTVAFLRKCLRAEGWRVLGVYPAPPLRLSGFDLMQRYNLDPKELPRIRDRLSRYSSVREDVFQKTADGFCAFLHYWIYVCTML